MHRKRKNPWPEDLMVIALIAVLGEFTVERSNGTPSATPEHFYCRNGSRIAMERRCDLKKDCVDESDEEGCSVHPRTKAVSPFQVEDRWLFKALWLDMEQAILSHSVLAGTVQVPWGDEIGLKFYYCRFILHEFYWFGVVGYNRFDNSRSCQTSQQSVHISIPKNYQVLQKSEETRNSWVKSTKGQIPDGALMVGLTYNYTIAFSCTLAQYHLQGTLYKKMLTVRGILIPTRGACWIPFVNTEFENPYREDYEVQVNEAFMQDPSCKQNDVFLCGDGSCILEDFVCDGDADCLDGSDEEITLCRILNNCSDSTFPCSDGKCISISKTCEGRNENKTLDLKINCHNGNDESSLTCPSILSDPMESSCMGFSCTVDTRCIPTDQRCDGSPRCTDVSDEDHCGMEICKHPLIKCLSTQKDIEARSWKQSPWTPYNTSHNNTLFMVHRSNSTTDRILCRVIETSVQESIMAVGTLERDRGLDAYVCKDSEYRSEFYGFLNIAYEGLMDSEGSWEWVDLKLNDFPDGGLVGGLTEEFEIYFICRWYRGEKGAWFYGRYRVRLGLCDYPLFQDIMPAWSVQVLVDGIYDR